MPAPVAPSLEIIVCETCRFPDGEREKDGRSGGQAMADTLRAQIEATPSLGGTKVSTQRCLMACKRACTLHLRTAGRMGYVLGDLHPDQQTAIDLTAYFAAYLATDDGVVPFREWPDVVKGRFVARVPPLPRPE